MTEKEYRDRRDQDIQEKIRHWNRKVAQGVAKVNAAERSLLYSLGQLQEWENFLTPPREESQLLIPISALDRLELSAYKFCEK